MQAARRKTVDGGGCRTRTTDVCVLTSEGQATLFASTTLKTAVCKSECSSRDRMHFAQRFAPDHENSARAAWAIGDVLRARD